MLNYKYALALVLFAALMGAAWADTTAPSLVSFSPQGTIVGNGAAGQAISIAVTDDVNLSYLSISLARDSTAVYDSNVNACTISGDTNTCAFTDYEVDRNGTYVYTFVTYDLAGNYRTDTNTFTFGDITVPSKPSTPKATDYNTTVALYWTASTENDLNKYGIYRSKGSGFDTNSETFVAYADTNSYTNSGLDENTTYYYKITAFDWTGNESVDSDQNYFETDYNYETAPTITRTDVGACDSNQWCSDNAPTFTISGVTNSVYSWFLTTSETTIPADCNYYSDCNSSSTATITLAANGTNYFKVRGCKPTGCGPAGTFILKIDSTSPSAPGSITATRSGYDVNLKWTAATDTGGSGMKYYNIYRSENASYYVSSITKIGYVLDGNLFYFDGTPTKGKTYYYKVIAVDTAGNLSSDSNISPTKVEIPPGGEETTITIKSINAAGEETQYYNKATDFNVTIIFSQAVNDFNFYKRFDDQNMTAIVTKQNNITYYSTTITTSAATQKVRLDVNAYSVTGDINKIYYLYLDTTNPTISFANVVDNNIVKVPATITFNAADNYLTRKIDFYLDGNKVGDGNFSNSTWEYLLDVNTMQSSGKVKAVAFDGAGNSTTSTELTILFDYNKLGSAAARTAINDANAKKVEVETYLRDQNTLNEQLLVAKKAADDLFAEAIALLEVDTALAKEKALLAMGAYAAILNPESAPPQDLNILSPGSLPLPTDFVVIMIIVAVSVVIALVLAIVVMKKKGPKKPAAVAPFLPVKQI